MSYIDREALIERLCYICGADCDKNICTVKQTIEYMPDADVEPIRHGKWVREDGGFVHCSVCNGSPLLDGEREYVETPFCPNCGAKLDGCK